jgi:hypothetical protein
MTPKGGGQVPADSPLAAAITRDFGSQKAMEEVSARLRLRVGLLARVHVQKIKSSVPWYVDQRS